MLILTEISAILETKKSWQYERQRRKYRGAEGGEGGGYGRGLRRGCSPEFFSHFGVQNS